jgi:hypothetical protein
VSGLLLHVARVLDVCGQHKYVIAALYTAVEKAYMQLKAQRERKKVQERGGSGDRSFGRGRGGLDMTTSLSDTRIYNGPIDVETCISDLSAALTLAESRLNTVARAYRRIIASLLKALEQREIEARSNPQTLVNRRDEMSAGNLVIELLRIPESWQINDSDDLLTARLEKIRAKKFSTIEATQDGSVPMMKLQLIYNNFYDDHASPQ